MAGVHGADFSGDTLAGDKGALPCPSAAYCGLPGSLWVLWTAAPHLFASPRPSPPSQQAQVRLPACSAVISTSGDWSAGRQALASALQSHVDAAAVSRGLAAARACHAPRPACAQCQQSVLSRGQLAAPHPPSRRCRRLPPPALPEPSCRPFDFSCPAAAAARPSWHSCLRSWCLELRRQALQRASLPPGSTTAPGSAAFNFNRRPPPRLRAGTSGTGAATMAGNTETYACESRSVAVGGFRCRLC